LPMETVRARLRFLHSVLEVPESDEHPIRLLHPSFRDFLLDNKRCKELQFWIDEKKAHNHLTICCLKLMSECLKKDMCNLQLPGALIIEVDKDKVNGHLPLAVQYACLYWVKHLQRSDMVLHENDQVHKFLQTHFLHWLEALSLIGEISEGVLAVKALEFMAIVTVS
jgi:hypothetical protein